MRNKVKILAFIFVIAIALNIRNVEAEQPWEIAINETQLYVQHVIDYENGSYDKGKRIDMYEESNILKIKLISYERYNNNINFSYNLDMNKYNYRIKVRIPNYYGGGGQTKDYAVDININSLDGNDYSNYVYNDYDIEKVISTLIPYKAISGSIRVCYLGNGDGRVFFSLERQLKNTNPTITLTQPTPNSPLQRIMIKK